MPASYRSVCIAHRCERSSTNSASIRRSEKSSPSAWTRVYRVAEATDHLARFVVFGSFVTNKPEAQDVDVFLVMEDTFGASRLAGDASPLFDHAAHKRTSVGAGSGFDIALRGQTNKPR